MNSLPDRHLVLLGTGGTIASARPAPGSADGDVRYRAGARDSHDLLAALPGAPPSFPVAVESVCNVGSQSISLADWQALVRRVAAHLTDPCVAGIVISHGTDTMEETAILLDLLFPRLDKPVVLTGAMRPADAPDADGPQNLSDALKLACDEENRSLGVLTVLAGRIHTARTLQKVQTSALDAFHSIGSGTISADGIALPEASRTGTVSATAAVQTRAAFVAATALPVVPVLSLYANTDPAVPRALLDLAPKALLVAGMGNGNMSDDLLALLEAHADQVAIVRASRVPFGGVRPNVEIDDAAHGFVCAGDLPTPAARLATALFLLTAKGDGPPDRSALAAVLSGASPLL